MTGRPVDSDRRLSLGLCAVAGLAALLTVAVPGVLHGTAAMNGSARGTAVVLLVAGIPTLFGLTLAGGRRATVLRLGTLGYVTYNGVMFLFGTPFNELFLLYVATLSLSLAALIALCVRIDAAALADGLVPARVRPAVAGFAGLVVVANTLLWLRGAVLGLWHAEHPAFLAGTGLPTAPTYVQDLSFWLPLGALAVVWMWRGRPWGTVLVGGFLAMWVLEAVSVAVDQWFGARADPQSPAVSSALVLPFALLALVTAGMLWLMLRPRGISARAVSVPSRPAGSGWSPRRSG